MKPPRPDYSSSNKETKSYNITLNEQKDELEDTLFLICPSSSWTFCKPSLYDLTSLSSTKIPKNLEAFTCIISDPLMNTLACSLG